MMKRFYGTEVSSLDEMVLTERHRKIFDNQLKGETQDLHNMLFIGGVGVGKTAMANIFRQMDWGNVDEIDTNDVEFSGAKGGKKLDDFIAGITTHKGGLSAFFGGGDQARGVLYIINEFQRMAEDRQRRINLALDDFGRSGRTIRVIATANLDEKIARNTADRFLVIDFGEIFDKKNKDHLISEKQRVAKIIRDQKEIDLSDSEIDAVAKKQHDSIRSFYKALDMASLER